MYWNRDSIRRYCLEGAAVLGTTAGAFLFWSFVAWRSPFLQNAARIMEAYVGLALVCVGGLWSLSLRTIRPRVVGTKRVCEPHPWKGRMLTAATLAGTLILFTLPLVSRLRSDTSNQETFEPGSSVFLLPYSDASFYYLGAERQLAVGRLDAWNSRRPLNALHFAVRLALVRNDFQSALLLQSCFLALSVWLLARVVQPDFGTPGSVILVGLLFCLGRIWSYTTLSESLGLTLGTLSAALLWVAARERNLPLGTAGIFGLTLALNCRAGAFVVLPFAVSWGALVFAKRSRISWVAVSGFSAAILAGFLLQYMCVRFYGNGNGLGHGNFAYVLYNLTVGEPGWNRIYVDFPASRDLSEDEMIRFIYEKSQERFRENPSRILFAYARGLLETPLRLLDIFLYQVPFLRPLIPYLVYVALVLFLNWIWRLRFDPRASLLLVQFLGVIASGPIVLPAIGPRGMAASFPMLCLAVVAAMNFPKSAAPTATDTAPVTSTLAVGMVSLLALFAVSTLIGPALIYSTGAYWPPTTDDAAELLLTGPGVPRLEIVPAASDEISRVPCVPQTVFLEAISLPPYDEDLRELASRVRSAPDGVLIALRLSFRDQPKLAWIIAPAALETTQWTWWRFHDQQLKGAPVGYVESYEPWDVAGSAVPHP